MKKKFKSVMFRVDGSGHIGFGHIMRCLTIAGFFQEKGYEIYFFTINYSNKIKEKIISCGFECIDLPNIGIEFLTDMAPSEYEYQLLDVNNCKLNINHTFDYIFIDNYRFDFCWEREMSNFCNSLIVIDDLANRKHFCNFLVDQSFGRVKSNYTQLVDDNTNLLLGSDYVILRKEFNELILRAKKKREDTVNVNNILVCLGGGDNTEYIKAIVDCIIDSRFTGMINISISKKDPYIIERYSNIKNIVIDVDKQLMSLKMLEADISIGAFGSMTWERCCLGLPSISIKIADNQSYIADSLDGIGVTIKSIVSEVPEKLLRLMDGNKVTDEWRDISNKSFGVCDGLGVKRILSEVVGK